MSLYTLAREDVARSTPRRRLAADGPAPSADKADPFDQLTRYLPTETITLFGAAIIACAPVQHIGYWWLKPWTIYCVFAVLTPVFLLALTYIKQREAEAAAGAPPAPFKPHPWPPIAALVAFLVWALSIQELVTTATLKEWGGLIAFGALSVSTVLSLIDKIIGLQRPAG